MLKPQKLSKGDKIALIAPSGRVSQEKLSKAFENVKKLGFEPVSIFTIDRNFKYFSGTDKQRIEELHWAFADKDIKAVWAIRGGYGATRILPYLNYDLIAQNPKIFLGFSDITALNIAFWQKINFLTFHGFVAGGNLSEYIEKQIFDLFIEKSTNYKLDVKGNVEIINHGEIRGKIIGGNLSLLVSLIGTDFEPNFAGKIVFIEEVAEPPYKIDRMLEHLLQTTDLSWANAIVLGQFNDCSPEKYYKNLSETYSLSEIFEEKFSELKIPVIYGVNFGHINDGLIFPIGAEAHLTTNPLKIEIIEQIFAD